MATKWQIQFQSLKGVPYTCNILESGYTGNIIRVQGAPDPFTVQEDNTEEYFHHVRTQTGYLRIIDTQTDMNGRAFDWSEMIPSNNTAHQVQLLRNGELVWIGYMKAALFTTQAFDYGNVVEFPLICRLALLDSVQLSFTSAEGSHPTMGQILYRALQATGIAWEFVDVANNVANLDDLNARVSMMNFTDVDPSVNTVTEVPHGQTTRHGAASWSRYAHCGAGLSIPGARTSISHFTAMPHRTDALPSHNWPMSYPLR